MRAARSVTVPGNASPVDNWQAGATPDAFASLVESLEHNFAAAGSRDWPASATAAREAIGRHIGKAKLLDGMRYVMCCTGYSRVLLHADPAGRFCVLGLVWPPGCITPVHAHLAWCALGLHTGVLEEETYAAWRDGESEPGGLIDTRVIAPGETVCDASDGRFVHRLANRSPGFAMSLHVYGVPPRHIGDGVNRILLD
jgi:predicted metal-dependent enzyme (double-stranded beta helix superfamily)